MCVWASECAVCMHMLDRCVCIAAYVLLHVCKCQCLCMHTKLMVVTWQTSERMPVFQKPWLLSSTVTSRRIVFFWRIFWRASCQTTSQSIIDPLEHSLRGQLPSSKPHPTFIPSPFFPSCLSNRQTGTCNKLKPSWHDTHPAQQWTGATGEETALLVMANWGTAMAWHCCGQWWWWCWLIVRLRSQLPCAVAPACPLGPPGKNHEVPQSAAAEGFITGTQIHTHTHTHTSCQPWDKRVLQITTKMEDVLIDCTS